MSIRSVFRLRVRQWLWFFGLWIAGIGSVAALAYLVKLVMGI